MIINIIIMFKNALKNINALQILKMESTDLQFIEKYVSNDRVIHVLDHIQSMQKRPIIQFGDKFKHCLDYNEIFDSINDIVDLTPLKQFLYNYFNKFGCFNQIEIRKYNKNNILPPHIDKVYDSDNDTIIMINVKGNANIIFENSNNIKFKINLSEGHVIILNKDARYLWTHELFVKSNNRISIIMRNIN